MEEGSPIWYFTGCWFVLPNKTLKTILVLMTVNRVPCGHHARLLVPPPHIHHRQWGQMPPMCSVCVNTCHPMSCSSQMLESDDCVILGGLTRARGLCPPSSGGKQAVQSRGRKEDESSVGGLSIGRGLLPGRTVRDRGQSEAGPRAMTHLLHRWDILSAGFRVHVRTTNVFYKTPMPP